MAGLIDPANKAFAITPNDGANLENITTAIYVGTAGDLKVDTINGDTVTFVCQDGTLLPVQIKKVYSTGTDATDLVGLY